MPRVLRPGHNCWRIERANRFALLVDASNYYGTLLKALRRVQQSFVLLAWDLDTRTQLFENDPAEGNGPLCEYLRDLVAHKPNLHIFVLPWSFSVLFADVRDPKLMRGTDPFQHPRIHFRMDDVHPPGGSHHQKIAIVDGKLAFVGGMDLAGGRWDTPEHLAKDSRRGSDENAYPPTHDVQAILDGDAAAALAQIADERWRRATGDGILQTGCGNDPWPAATAVDIADVDVGISRTDPLTSRREVEQLHLDLIATAREFLYIENQYLTSILITDALRQRLLEIDGPEIIMVLPLNNHGWLEDHTVEALRFRQVRRLREADRFGRLRICYPTVRALKTDDEDESIVVHSKILVADDRLFRVGSSNLTDRSMRLDTECDLTIEAGNEVQRAAIASLRNRLLGEHLGLSPETVGERLAQERSLTQLIDSCFHQSRCLRELPSDGGATQILPTAFIDPPEPLTTGFVLRTLAGSAVRSRWFWLVAGVTMGVVLATLTARKSRR